MRRQANESLKLTKPRRIPHRRHGSRTRLCGLPLALAGRIEISYDKVEGSLASRPGNRDRTSHVQAADSPRSSACRGRVAPMGAAVHSIPLPLARGALIATRSLPGPFRAYPFLAITLRGSAWAHLRTRTGAERCAVSLGPVDRVFATPPDSPGQCEPGLSDDRPRDPRFCYCPELSPRATRSSSS